MSMLSERIIGTMCLNREEGDGVPTICYQTQTQKDDVSFQTLNSTQHIFKSLEM